MTISLDYLEEINKYSRILKVKRIFMASLEGIFVLGFLLLMDSVTVIYFLDYHGLSEEQAGLMFSIPFIGFTVSFMVYPFIAHRFHPRTLLFFSLFLTSFFVLLLWGPSKLLGMPDNYQAMVAGSTLGRFCTGFGFASVLPELAEACLEHFDIHHLPPEIADKNGTMFSAIIAIGSVVFPQVVSILFGAGIAYRTITDAFGIIGLLFATLYISVVFERGIGLFALKSVDAAAANVEKPAAQEEEAVTRRREDDVEMSRRGLVAVGEERKGESVRLDDIGVEADQL